MTAGKNRAGMFLWGGLALITGLPFLAAGVSASLLSGRLGRGLSLTAVLLFAVWYFTGFHGAGVTAVCAATAAIAAGSGFSLMKTLYWTAGLTLLAGALLSLAFPGFMNIGEQDLEPLREVYLSAGMETAVIDRVFFLIVHYSPGIGAIQLTAGAIAAGLFFRSLPGIAKAYPQLTVPARFRMHWGTAWIPIMCLLAIVYSRSSEVPPLLLRASGNLLLFSSLPYFIEGLQTTVHWARAVPGMVILLVISAFFAIPVVAAMVLLAGILDTWFDFRTKIDQRTERMKNEDSSDKDR